MRGPGTLRAQLHVDRPAAKTLQDLVAWQRAHKFTLAVYQMTVTFPKCETFGLTSQIRRAAVSVPANVAEGFKRRSRGDKLRFLNIAQASLEECRYYLILTNDLHYADVDSPSTLLEEASKCLEGYVQRILNSGF